MARALGIESEGALSHLTGRCNERKRVFRDERDRMPFPRAKRSILTIELAMRFM